MYHKIMFHVKHTTPKSCSQSVKHWKYRKCETLFLKEILNNQVLDVVVAGK